MNMTRTILSLSLLLAGGMAPPALAQASEPSLAGLDVALRNRLADKGPLTTGSERAQLQMALRNLVTYEGLSASFIAPDAGQLPAVLQDLERLVRVAASVQASETEDVAVRFHVEAIRETLDGFFLDVQQAALTSIPLLLLEENREVVEEAVAAGTEERGDAIELWILDYGEGAERLVEIVPAQHTAAEFGMQAVMDEAVMFPVDVEPMPVTLDRDFMPIAGEPIPLQVGVAITRPVPELTIAVRAVAMDSAAGFAGPMGTPKQTTLGVMTCLDVQPGDTLPPISLEVPPFEDEMRVVTSGTEPQLSRGGAVDIDGDTAVVSYIDTFTPNFEGRVAIHERFAGDIDTWLETAVLELPASFSPTGDELFGEAVAIDGDTVVVGAIGYDAFPGGNTSGAAFVYQRDGEGNWSFVSELFPPMESDEFESDFFGAAVDVSGDRIVVGAPQFDTCGDGCLGEVFLFERNEGGPDAWGLKQTLDSGNDRNRGTAVAIDGDILAVGAPNSPGGGFELVEVYEYDAQSDSFVIEDILHEDGKGASEFGSSLALDEASGLLVVGAPGTSSESGDITIFQRDGDCDNVPGAVCYEEVRTLRAPNPVSGDGYGTSVALTSSADPASQMLVVGAPGFDHPMGGPTGGGAAFVYVRGHAPGCPDPMPVPGGWGLLARRLSERPTTGAAFGRAVAVSSAHLARQTIDGRVMDLEVPPTLLVGEPFSSAQIGVDCDGDGVPDDPILDDPENCPSPFTIQRNGAAHFLNGMDPIMAGMYEIVIDVDPHQRIIEMDGAEAEGNNAMYANQPVTICVPSLEPNLAVTEVQLTPVEPCDTDLDGMVDGERGFILATPDGNQINGPGINVTVEMTGGFDGVITSAMLRASVIRGSGEYDARFWNAASESFDLLSVPVPPIASGESVSLHLDVEFDVDEGDLFLQQNNELVDIRVEVFSPATDTNPDDDERIQTDQCWTTLELEGCIFPDPPNVAGGLSRATNWGKKMGNDEFNANLAFDGSLDMVRRERPTPHDISPQYPGQEYGAVGSLDASLDFAVFGRQQDDVVKFCTLAERDPLYTHPDIGRGYGFFEVSLEALGYTFFSAGPVDSFTLLEAAQSGEDLPKGFCLVYADGSGTEVDCEKPFPSELPIGFRFQREFSKDKTFPDRKKKQCCRPSGSTIMLTEAECCNIQGFVINDDDDNVDDEECESHSGVFGPCRQLPRLGRTFFPGGFPVDVDAAAKGTIGINFGANVLNDFTFDVTPFVGLGVQVEVKIPGGSKYHAGVRGTVTLCRYDHIRRSGIGMTLVEGDPDLVTICGLQCFKVTHRLTFLQGKIEAFATYPWPKFCSGPFGIPLPCGIKSKTSSFDIINWPPAFEVQIPGENECGPNVCPLFVNGTLLCPPPPSMCSPSPCDVDPVTSFRDLPRIELVGSY